MSRHRSPFSCVRTEGGVLTADLLSRIQTGDSELVGLTAESYHLDPHVRIGEAANRAWSRLVASWKNLTDALAGEGDGAASTGVTRERWLLPLFEELGYGRLQRAKPLEIDEKVFPISHGWQHTPIHLLGVGVDLERRQAGVAGAAKASPHGLVQELLNRSDEHLWGFVSNGRVLRLLRDHHSLTRQAYVEFDLQAIMDGEQYSEFLLLWMVCHQSRVEGDPAACWLERWYDTSRDDGVRALDKLRGGVEAAIAALGTGFLAHRANGPLRDALESGHLDKQDYYRQLLRLVYRVIFLFVAEERDALLDPAADAATRARYSRFYATRRVRELANRRRGGAHGDLWQRLRLVMSKLDGGCPELGLPALGSRLWSEDACRDLMRAECANEHVLEAVRRLSIVEEGRTRYPVNWRNIGADELGSVYEGLLELHPRINREAATFELDTAAGHERKTTGSYYTKSSLVDCLLESALDPVLDEAASSEDPEAALLALKVCDPACGSGHFLVAAAHRMAHRLAAARAGDEEPSPPDLQRALRDVVGRSIYGVDLNPMAVELCKVSLWLEAIEPGKPLSFLDHHIQSGNSFLGTTPSLMAEGIPDDAWNPIEGDDKKTASKLKKQNKKERMGGQQSPLFGSVARDTGKAAEARSSSVAHIEGLPDDTVENVASKERRWKAFVASGAVRHERFRADMWCAAFVWPKVPAGPEPPTHDRFEQATTDPESVTGMARLEVERLAGEYAFFHWHVAFPGVFHLADERPGARGGPGWKGGFDVVLSNPPWEHTELKEKEFFASRSDEIAKAATGAARKRLIAELAQTDRALYEEFVATKRLHDGVSRFAGKSGRYPLCGRGRINTYPIFAELMRGIIDGRGRVGCILPSGIATDDTTKFFFQDLMEGKSLVSLYDFENRKKLFPIDSRIKFVLLTMVGPDRPVSDGAEFAFFLHDPAELENEDRRFRLLAEDIELLNPNTKTCAVFRTRRDAELTKQIYRRVPVLIREGPPEENPWGVSFRQGLFNMTSDSHVFRTREELEGDGWTLVGNVFERGGEKYLPLYEAKMIHHFDHRWATYDGGKTRELTPEEKADPNFAPLPRYWVTEAEVAERLVGRWEHDWLLGWRDICRNTDERTVIACVIPRVGVGNNLPITTLKHSGSEVAGLLACISSFAFDFVSRFKVGGTHLNFFIAHQLPVLPPCVFSKPAPWEPDSLLAQWIAKRVVGLVRTAHDLVPFSHALGSDDRPHPWDEEARFATRCELDAAMFHLYGLSRDDVEYVMHTFPIVERRDQKEYGRFRTLDAILEAYDAMRNMMDADASDDTVGTGADWHPGG